MCVSSVVVFSLYTVCLRLNGLSPAGQRERAQCRTGMRREFLNISLIFISFPIAVRVLTLIKPPSVQSHRKSSVGTSNFALHLYAV